MNEQQLWEKVVAFHGHECGGLTIGFKAALYAMELLEPTFADDEETVCVSETDACGVDAIQVLLGCTIGKGNLLFHMTGKQAFSFYNRETGKSVRLVLRPLPEGMNRCESFDFMKEKAPSELFDIKETKIALPEEARIFESFYCECCGERTGANWIRLQGDKKLCIDCYQSYDRFSV